MIKWALLFIAVFFTPLATGFGADIAFPSLETEGQGRTYAQLINSGNYTWQDILEIGLWASGVNAAPVSGQSGQELVLAAAEELRNSPSLPAGLRERGEFVLTYAHQKFLKSYSILQTRLDLLLSSGRYNCVSSAVLYTILASSIGLDVIGVVTKDHAFATALIENESIDVETTNPYGFDPGTRREFHDGFGKVTGFAYVPARNYRDRTSISQLELVSLILHNRIVELERNGRYHEAIPLALDRAALLQNRPDAVNSAFFSDPEKDLDDRLYNFGGSLVQAGKEAEAIRWTELVEEKWPHNPRWQELRYIALNNLLNKMVQNGKLAGARETLDLYISRLSPADFDSLNARLLDAELVHLSAQIKTTEEAEAAIKIVNDAEARSLIPAGRAKELRTFFLLKKGEWLAAAEGWAAAILFMEASIAKYGRTPQLENHLRVFRQNRVADLHNAFAESYNRKDFAQARSIIQKALEEFPGNRQLEADRNLVEKNLGN